MGLLIDESVSAQGPVYRNFTLLTKLNDNCPHVYTASLLLYGLQSLILPTVLNLITTEFF